MQNERILTEDQISDAKKVALDIFREYKTREALAIAVQVYADTCTDQTITSSGIPATVVFKNEGIDTACRRLLKTIHTPDITLIDLSAKRFGRLIEQTTPDEGLRVDLSEELIRAIAHKELNDFELYIDLGRQDPDATTDWIALLADQFGPFQLSNAISFHKRLFKIIDQTRLLRDPFLDALADNAKQGECPMRNYQEKAYALRGLRLETISEDS